MSSKSVKTLISGCRKADLLKDLIWPAVAGNVAWTFFSVLLTILQPETVRTTKPEEAVIVRLIAILLLSGYLGIVYLMSCNEANEESKSNRGLFDILHSLTIIFCAISFQLRFNEFFCNICLTVFWAIAAIGHLLGAWIPKDVNKNKCWKQVGMAGISIFGIILCWILSSIPNNWNLVISLSAGLILWGFLRHRLYS